MPINISKIEDRNSFKKWLESLPKEDMCKIAPILAYRCILRIAIIDDIQSQLVMLRILIMTQACHKNLNNTDVYGINAVASHSGTAAIIRTARKAYDVTHAANIRAYADAVNATAYVANRSINGLDSATLAFARVASITFDFNGSRDSWFILQQDILLYQQNINISQCHLWYGNENIPNKINQELRAWQEYHDNNPDEHWDIWIKFYEEAIEGRDYFHDNVLKELATWEDKQWQREPAIVNQEIKDLCRHFDKLSDPSINNDTTDRVAELVEAYPAPYDFTWHGDDRIKINRIGDDISVPNNIAQSIENDLDSINDLLNMDFRNQLTNTELEPLRKRSENAKDSKVNQVGATIIYDHCEFIQNHFNNILNDGYHDHLADNPNIKTIKDLCKKSMDRLSFPLYDSDILNKQETAPIKELNEEQQEKSDNLFNALENRQDLFTLETFEYIKIVKDNHDILEPSKRTYHQIALAGKLKEFLNKHGEKITVEVIIRAIGEFLQSIWDKL